MSKNSRIRRQSEKNRERREQENERAFVHANSHTTRTLRQPLPELPIAANAGNGNGHAPPHTSIYDPPTASVLAPPQTTADAIARVSESVEQIRLSDAKSKQPRFSPKQAAAIFQQAFKWVSSLNEPEGATVAKYDNWLRTMVMLEPHIAGVYSSIVGIDKNRHYSVVGGRNQVNRVLEILQNADGGRGWRFYCGWQSESYWATRMGFVSELGRDSENGPLRALWSVDPCMVELRASSDYPLAYLGGGASFGSVSNGGKQLWRAGDFFRGASMPSTDEKLLGLGTPFALRALEFTKIMVAVWQHDKEQLGAAAPKGLLLLRGIDQDQWDEAMQARAEDMTASERTFYGGVAVLANLVDELSAQLIALSSLPKDFSLEMWVNLYMYGLALCAGYDPREFYPVSGGTLGSGTETETQHRKASSKGDLDFSLAFQEQVQRQLPETILFQFEQRDIQGERDDVALLQEKADLIETISGWEVNGLSVFTPEQILELGAQHGVIPQEWTEAEENMEGGDEFPTVDETLANERVLRAAQRYPNEPLVEYSSRGNRIRVLANAGGDLIRRRTFPVLKTRLSDLDYGRERVREKTLRYVYHHSPAVQRSVESAVSDFEDRLTSAIEGFFDGDTLRTGDIREIVSDGIYRAYTQALKEGGIPEDEIEADEFAAMDALTVQQSSYVNEFVKAIRDAKGDESKEDAIRARITMWTNSVRAAGTAGLASVKKNEMVTWKRGATEEGCDSCIKLDGTRHRRSWYDSRGFVPRQAGSKTLTCGGWLCDCTLEP